MHIYMHVCTCMHQQRCSSRAAVAGMRTCIHACSAVHAYMGQYRCCMYSKMSQKKLGGRLRGPVSSQDPLQFFYSGTGVFLSVNSVSVNSRSAMLQFFLFSKFVPVLFTVNLVMALPVPSLDPLSAWNMRKSPGFIRDSHGSRHLTHRSGEIY